MAEQQPTSSSSSTVNIESEKNAIESVAFEFEPTQTNKFYRNGKIGNLLFGLL